MWIKLWTYSLETVLIANLAVAQLLRELPPHTNPRFLKSPLLAVKWVATNSFNLRPTYQCGRQVGAKLFCSVWGVESLCQVAYVITSDVWTQLTRGMLRDSLFSITLVRPVFSHEWSRTSESVASSCKLLHVSPYVAVKSSNRTLRPPLKSYTQGTFCVDSYKCYMRWKIRL